MHPGEVLLVEFLNTIRMTRAEFAAHLGIPTQRVDEIIKGEPRSDAGDGVAVLTGPWHLSRVLAERPGSARPRKDAAPNKNPKSGA